MKISELMDANLVVAQLQGTTKNQVLEELVQHLAQARPGIEPGELLRVLIEREKLGSTGIGNGIAIPHGKLAGLDQIVLVFGKSTDGIDFDAIDSSPVHLLFLLVAPTDSAGQHLKALARLSRLLKSPEFRDSLMGSETADAIFGCIQQADEQIAT